MCVCVNVWNNMQHLIFIFILIQPSRRGQMQPDSQFEVLLFIALFYLQELILLEQKLWVM